MAFPYCLEALRQYEAHQLSVKHRELLVRTTISQAIPHWWQFPFNFFNICPVSSAMTALSGNTYELSQGGAYRLLNMYHCVPQWHIPKEIYKQMPGLIREVLFPESIRVEYARVEVVYRQQIEQCNLQLTQGQKYALPTNERRRKRISSV